jgi:predicted DNA-binding transcriptional regulator AlpA
MSSINFWFEAVIGAYLDACARGEDWRAACATAQAKATQPRRVLTRRALQAKGLTYSRQHLARKVAAGTFPAPFKLSENVDDS